MYRLPYIAVMVTPTLPGSDISSYLAFVTSTMEVGYLLARWQHQSLYFNSAIDVNRLGIFVSAVTVYHATSGEVESAPARRGEIVAKEGDYGQRRDRETRVRCRREDRTGRGPTETDATTERRTEDNERRDGEDAE